MFVLFYLFNLLPQADFSSGNTQRHTGPFMGKPRAVVTITSAMSAVTGRKFSRILEAWKIIWSSPILHTGIAEQERKQKRAERIFKEVTAPNSPTLMRNISLQIQEDQQSVMEALSGSESRQP